MGFFSSFRKKSAATSASSDSSSTSPEQDDEVQREWRQIEESERKQQRAAEKAREREAKTILSDRKKQQQAIAKQQKKEQDAADKQLKKEQDAIKNARKRERRQRENDRKLVLKERKRAEKLIKQAEKERKRAAKKELNAVVTLVNQARNESKKKAREAKRQAFRLKRAQRVQERARKRVLRQQEREEKKRLRRQAKHAAEQLRFEEELEHHRMELAQSTVVVATEAQPTVLEGQVAMAQPVIKQAPRFKARLHCAGCHIMFLRLPNRFRHHCRNCGESYCNSCLSTSRRPMPWIQLETPQRICVPCDVVVMRGMQGADRAIETTAQGVAPVEEERSAPPRSLSLSEQPVSESVEEETPSPSSGVRRRHLGLRSRGSGSSKSGKKYSIWNLPLRPLLKRKESADQLRNRTWDLDLQLEKAEQFAKMSGNARVLDMAQLQPVLATAS